MLWTQVIDFYIRYIFGGRASNGQSYSGWITFNSNGPNYSTSSVVLNDFLGIPALPLGNYLSLISTIITMVVILLLCCWFIKKIISIVFRLFNGGGAL